MKQLKHVNCFGTSFTDGGGHEFGKRDGDYGKYLKEVYRNKYPNEEQTQFNFSWPGQLQKLFKENNLNISVINHAKSGYGNERLFRKTFEITNSDGFDKNAHLFLFEFAMGPGRRELWSNTLNDYIITNFHFNEDNDMSLDYHGAANNYFYDSRKTANTLNKFSEEVISPFYKETVSFKNQLDVEEMYLSFFIPYLISNDINFIITNSPGYHHGFSITKSNDVIIIDDEFGLTTSNFCNFGDSFNFTDYYRDRVLTIENDTNGKCKDGHMGMNGAKEVSQILYDRMIELSYFK